MNEVHDYITHFYRPTRYYLSTSMACNRSEKEGHYGLSETHSTSVVRFFLYLCTNIHNNEILPNGHNPLETVETIDSEPEEIINSEYIL